MEVKPENEPLYFLAVHPRGSQKYWVEKFEQVFEDPIPTAACPQTFINCVIDEDDKEGYPYAFHHTRFHFGDDVIDEDLPLIMEKMKDHVLTTNLQVALFEDKFDTEILTRLETTDRLEDFLQLKMFPRLVKSISFVRDVERAIEAIANIKDVNYDPDAIHLSISIDANDMTEEWADRLAAWDVEGVLVDAFYQLTRFYGRPNWVLGGEGEDKDEDDECFHLTVFFGVDRICIGIEVFEDKDFHPYLATNIQTIDGGLASLIARFIEPQKGDFILEIGMQNCDIAMATLYEFECIYFIATPVIDDLENTMATWRSVKEEIARRGGNPSNRELQIIKYADLSLVQECDQLYIADRVVFNADCHPSITTGEEYVAFLDGMLTYLWMANPLSPFTVVVPMIHRSSVLGYFRENNKLTVLKEVTIMTSTEYVTIMELRHSSFDIFNYSQFLAANYRPVLY